MKTIFLIATCLLACPCVSVWAQSGGTYDMSGSKITGGGRPSAGGSYSLACSLGQPDAVVFAGGSYSVTAGFWSAAPTGASPVLAVRVIAPNAVAISWPVAAQAFALEQSATLTSNSQAWTPVPPPYQTNQVSIEVALPIGPGNTFFRLRKP